MNRIEICKRCKKPEFYGQFRWLNGKCTCRSCYKALFELEHKIKYKWDDLDGKRPTIEEYLKQKEE